MHTNFRLLLAALSIVSAFGCVAVMAEERIDLGLSEIEYWNQHQTTNPSPIVTAPGAMCRSHRPVHVTYGGLAPLSRFERDHHIPLCLGGMDTRVNCNDSPLADEEPRTAECNVWYEPIEEALEKNKAEAKACRDNCHAGPAAIEAAREDFRLGNWRKWLEP